IVARFPDGVLTMETALYYHGYIDERPKEWALAISKNISKSRFKLDFPEIRTFFTEEDAVYLGADKMELAGGEIFIYSVDRLICDVLKYREKMTPETFRRSVEAYIADERKDLNRLMEYAGPRRVYSKVTNTLGPWLDLPERPKNTGKKTGKSEEAPSNAKKKASDLGRKPAKEPRIITKAVEEDGKLKFVRVAEPPGRKTSSRSSARKTGAASNTGENKQGSQTVNIPATPVPNAPETAPTAADASQEYNHITPWTPAPLEPGTTAPVVEQGASMPVAQDSSTPAKEEKKRRWLWVEESMPIKETEAVPSSDARISASEIRTIPTPNDRVPEQAIAAAPAYDDSIPASPRDVAVWVFSILQRMELMEDLGIFVRLYYVLQTHSVDGIEVSRRLIELCEEDDFPLDEHRIAKMRSWSSNRFMEQKWIRFIKRHNDLSLQWSEVIGKLSDFVVPIGLAMVERHPFTGEWMPKLGRFL
ncbi:MAG: hypothetical protein IJV04_05475, partial [Lachnospiraceae bacterium]|nr:hypothetical protein [Lachnospiraceae bacterium]